VNREENGEKEGRCMIRKEGRGGTNPEKWMEKQEVEQEKENRGKSRGWWKQNQNNKRKQSCSDVCSTNFITKS
jgi:hypothetical protein